MNSAIAAVSEHEEIASSCFVMLTSQGPAPPTYHVALLEASRAVGALCVGAAIVRAADQGRYEVIRRSCPRRPVHSSGSPRRITSARTTASLWSLSRAE
jgi:hypothetical protein